MLPCRHKKIFISPLYGEVRYYTFINWRPDERSSNARLNYIEPILHIDVSECRGEVNVRTSARPQPRLLRPSVFFYLVSTELHGNSRAARSWRSNAAKSACRSEGPADSHAHVRNAKALLVFERSIERCGRGEFVHRATLDGEHRQAPLATFGRFRRGPTRVAAHHV